ncbi:MAG: glutamine synthetase, partial [Bacteroidota bacterium]
ALFAGELEWFNFEETPRSLADKGHRDPQPITPGMFGYSVLRTSQKSAFFHSLFDDLHRFKIPLEGLHTETGDGVYEACIFYDDVLESADRMALMKTSIKEIAYRHKQMASFMAKWNPDLPGCSGHLHQSLWQGDKNVFFDERAERGISSVLESYIAGQLYCLPYILPMYAPIVNSYKRLVAGSWAAVSASWGIENRTAALRVIPGGAHSTRLETRVPGADANPYLSMAAALASGLYGIKNKLRLDTPRTKGNEYDNKERKPLPRSLKEAVDQMKNSPIPKALFGEGFVDHFIRTREWEWSQFLSAVTDWEMKRYFEII